MRRLIFLVILVFALPLNAYQSAIELLRPTADADAHGMIPACIIHQQASLAMPRARDAAGLTTQNTMVVVDETFTYKARSFSPWASTSKTYTALVLKVNAQSGTDPDVPNAGGLAFMGYSINGGTSWVTIIQAFTPAGWPRQTFSITLSPTQNLSQLRLGVCVAAQGTTNNPGFDQLIIWDIWTEGTYTAGGGGGGGPVLPTQKRRDIIWF